MISNRRLAISSASTPATTEMQSGAPVHGRTPKTHQQSRLILPPAVPEMATTPSKQYARRSFPICRACTLINSRKRKSCRLALTTASHRVWIRCIAGRAAHLL